MANYRVISPSFWTDSKVSDNFSPEDKYFYLYLLSNQYTNICGCYELSLKSAANELGYDLETVQKLIKRMESEYNVIRYNRETKEVLILKWHKYNWTLSDKLIKGVTKVASYIKTTEFKEYIFAILEAYSQSPDTVSIPYPYPMDTSVSVSVSVSDDNYKYNTISDSHVKNTGKEKQQESINTNAFEKSSSHARGRKSIPPTIEEVGLYCQERKNGLDPEEFWDFYASKGWKVGNTPMTDWQASVRTWEKRHKKKPQKVFLEDSTAYLAAVWLSEDLHLRFPTVAEASPEQLQVWASVFDKMENYDQHPPEEILALMKFACRDDFWKLRIENPWSIRKNYIKILAQAKQKGKIK